MEDLVKNQREICQSLYMGLLNSSEAKHAARYFALFLEETPVCDLLASNLSCRRHAVEDTMDELDPTGMLVRKIKNRMRLDDKERYAAMIVFYRHLAQNRRELVKGLTLPNRFNYYVNVGLKGFFSLFVN